MSSIIFIFSTPRSGSTLLQRLLGEHPDIFTDVESWFLLHPIYALRDKGINTEYGHIGAQRALMHYLNNFTEGNKTFNHAVAAYYNTLCESVLRKTNKKFFLDKSPPYTRVIKEITDIFPDAKFIFLARNPLGNLYSVLTTWTKGHWDKLYWSAYDLMYAPYDLVEGYNYVSHKSLWISYEDLVLGSVETLRCIYNYLGFSTENIIENYAPYQRPKAQANSLFTGDPENIDKFNKPMGDFSQKWLYLADNPQTLHFAESYLNALGEQLIDSLGYSQGELKDALHIRAEKSDQSVWSKHIIPWKIAVKSSSERTRPERLLLAKVESMQKNGDVKGYSSFLIKNFSEILKSTLKQEKL